MFRPPISYFVLALFRYKFRLRARVHVGWLQLVALPGSNWPSGQYSSPSIRHCFRLLVKKTTSVPMLRSIHNAWRIKLVEIYSRLKTFVIPPEKTLSRQRSFEEGYNELNNVAINLTQTCISEKFRTFLC